MRRPGRSPRVGRLPRAAGREIVAAEGRVRILVGHVLDRLRELPDESVHCVITSPPYWGLRNYGTEPQVWGGDAGCRHEWDPRRYYVEGGGGARCSGEAFSEPGRANAARIKKARWREDATCRKCGAWLGQLGLEPTPELYTDLSTRKTPSPLCRNELRHP